MYSPLPFYRSTIGKKVVVAGTGLVMFGFVVGHLLGNLQIFEGPKQLNDYAAFLKEGTHGLIWVARAILLLSVAAHVTATVQLTGRNLESRPVPYERHEMIQATLASRLMLWSGAFLGLYIVYHIFHLTFGLTHPDFSPRDVYGNVIIGFSSRPVSCIYILAMIALGFHLYHGASSMFQTLGLNHPKYNDLRKKGAAAAAVVIALGYISIPLAVMLGRLHL